MTVKGIRRRATRRTPINIGGLLIHPRGIRAVQTSPVDGDRVLARGTRSSSDEIPVGSQPVPWE